MPVPAAKTHPELDERLSQLIRLKRLERPDGAFWERFEQEYRSKQLSGLVTIMPWYERIATKCIRIARKTRTRYTATAAAVIAVALLAMSNYSQIAQTGDATSSEIVAVETESLSEPLFVVAIDTDKNVPLEQLLPTPNPNPPATYQVSVMTKPSDSTGYQLISLPVILSNSDKSEQSKLGAQVITAEREF